MFNRLDSLFRGSGGFGGADDPAVAQLLKSLAATGSADPGGGFGTTGFRSTIYENLERTFKVTTFGEAEFANTLFFQLKKSPVEAKALIHEFVKLTDYGKGGAFASEEGGKNGKDVSLERDYVQVKFLRDKREWSHVSDFVDAIESPEALQTLGATMFLISSAERALYDGDSAVVPSEYDGLGKMVESEKVIDLAGRTILKADLNNAALQMFRANTYGVASEMYMSPAVQAQLDNILEAPERIVLPHGNYVPSAANDSRLPDSSIFVGSPVAGYRSSFGTLQFKPHNFVGFDPTPSDTATASAAPNAPGTFTATVSAGAVAGSAFNKATTGDRISDAGTYLYKVTAVNADGESATKAAAAGAVMDAAACDAGKAVELEITLAADGETATGVHVYRTRADGANYYLIARLPKATSATYGTNWTAATRVLTWTDKNARIAGTDNAYVVDMKSTGQRRTLAMAQLAPMGSYGLPMGDATYRKMFFLYMALLCYNPRKLVLVKNIEVGNV